MLSTNAVRPQAAPFDLGRWFVTPGAGDTLDGQTIQACFARHAKRDFGSVCAEDFDANLDAIAHGDRILSVYHCKTKDGADTVKVYVITEADRSSTTLLLSEEY